MYVVKKLHDMMFNQKVQRWLHRCTLETTLAWEWVQASVIDLQRWFKIISGWALLTEIKSRKMVAKGWWVGELDRGWLKVQTFSYKMNKAWVPHVKYDYYSW